MVTAGVLIVAAAGLAAYYFILPHAALRVTTGALGTTAHRFVSAFAATTVAQHPRVQIRLVEVADLAASAKAIENHAVDLAIIRSDAALPANGETIAILRRDVFAVVTPAKTAIDKIPGLVDRTIGIPAGPLQSYNEHALDTILSYYNIQPGSVKRVFLPMAEIGRALAEKRIAAVLAIGPIGPGEVVDVVAAVKAATKSSPKILGIDEATPSTSNFPDSNRSTFRPARSGVPRHPGRYRVDARCHLPVRRAEHHARHRGRSHRAIAVHRQGEAYAKHASGRADRGA